ncbi:MAG: hypothetical protein CFE39_05490 [Comamonadaceae bacterium PBBC2]|nr:MAG: hypothetical protein CFE39_05490 [Comamonadaceae bacterium PBBC2]
MKICVLIPTKEQEAQAGVRIRYSRVEPALRQMGHQLDLVPIQDLTDIALRSHDIYLISKCYDARSLLTARQLKQAGKIVGVDLFDDYFSQNSDPRFARLRYWLKALVAQCAFVLCSTPRMRDISLQYAPSVPVHVLNDPAPDIDSNAIADALQRKLDFARAQRQISVAWFGMGDNPNFPLGLTDLAAFGCEIDRLRGNGFEVVLEILTNRRAMTPDALAALRCLATPYTIREWDEAGERELLSRSIISFLPVNAQSFSRVKSMNRAVTALSAGVQVLSAGYPLYENFGPLIYRDPRQFLRDLHNGALALRAETTSDLADKLREMADTTKEAEALTRFLYDTKSGSLGTVKDSRTAVIQGKEILADVHKFAQKHKVLSVASPFSRPGLKYDVIFTFSQQKLGFDIAIRERIAGWLDKKFSSLLLPNALSVEYRDLALDAEHTAAAAQVEALAALKTTCSEAAAYPVVMCAVVDALKVLFPHVTCFYGEQSRHLPWHVADDSLRSKGEVRQ